MLLTTVDKSVDIQFSLREHVYVMDCDARKCTKCRRPCVGHIGPTGPHCSLTPVPEWDLSFNDDNSVKTATSEPGEVAVVHKKLDSIRQI
jgi:hypothetical protein